LCPSYSIAFTKISNYYYQTVEKRDCGSATAELLTQLECTIFVIRAKEKPMSNEAKEPQPEKTSNQIIAGLAIGAAIGTALVIVFDNIFIGITIGASLGLIFAAALSKKSKKG
jgi:uncharacterized membrane protein